MRILHSSDWHLGQHFMGKTRQAEHAAFCGWLLEQLQAHQVDVLLIAGDIFDTGSPPSYAREQYNQLVVALRNIGVQLVVLGGNHDSVATLSESRSILHCLGAEVIAAAGVNPAEQILELRDRSGNTGAILCAVPFLRARDLLRSEAGQSAQDKQQALQEAIAEHYQRLYQLAQQRAQTLGLELPIIATGHLTTVGASASESVREIYVGSLEAFPTSAFPPADYIALGHIHRPQKVGGLEHIRYSGSPLPLSFDEVEQQKQVLLVDFAQSKLSAIHSLEVPCFQHLQSLRSDLKQLPGLLQKALREVPQGQQLWLELVIEGDDYLSDLHTRVAQLCADFPVEVLRLRRARSAQAGSVALQTGETLDELTVEQVFARRLAQESLEAPIPEQLTELYRQLVNDLAESD